MMVSNCEVCLYFWYWKIIGMKALINCIFGQSIADFIALLLVFEKWRFVKIILLTIVWRASVVALMCSVLSLGRLAKEHSKKEDNYEQRLRTLLRDKQQSFEETYQQEIEHYKVFGETQSESNTTRCLERRKVSLTLQGVWRDAKWV